MGAAIAHTFLVRPAAEFLVCFPGVTSASICIVTVGAIRSAARNPTAATPSVHAWSALPPTHPPCPNPSRKQSMIVCVKAWSHQSTSRRAKPHLESPPTHAGEGRHPLPVANVEIDDFFIVRDCPRHQFNRRAKPHLEPPSTREGLVEKCKEIDGF